PSIDIFEAFDELLLTKRQVKVFYYGPLGQNSQKFIEYFRMTKISTLKCTWTSSNPVHGSNGGPMGGVPTLIIIIFFLNFCCCSRCLAQSFGK
ncbi:hypothetical protein PanWU01x14_195770, partial [Parasponia andersonii]